MLRRLALIALVGFIFGCAPALRSAPPTQALAAIPTAAPTQTLAPPSATATRTPTRTFTPQPTRTPSPTPYPITLSPTPTLAPIAAAPEPSRELRRPTIDTSLILPDLRMLPPSHLVIEITPADERLLRLTTLIINWGPGKLEVLGKSDATTARTVVMQHVYRANGAYDERAAGIFLFHITHNHWHVEDFANYQVWSLTPEGKPAEIVARSDKISFCLRDTGRSTLEVAPEEPQYTECEAELQGMSAGWIDAYEWDTPGQTIDITALSDGVYALVSVVDPSNRLLELDENNNDVTIYFLLREDSVEILELAQVLEQLDAAQ